ncbi:hypothetical protein PPACK8108_LOCUS15493 [Phakopsora pachyrhizi]|uniref:Uncharacterized protein n=1 Tax=Phakopsora pachyrhizi TaxID=170000 RepID=A0AAV0B9F6_PHAPC|nr:hypothetical protein PPACK8108_LOCUS15493 [Phakopsora pachyrhizi]
MERAFAKGPLVYCNPDLKIYGHEFPISDDPTSDYDSGVISTGPSGRKYLMKAVGIPNGGLPITADSWTNQEGKDVDAADDKSEPMEGRVDARVEPLLEVPSKPSSANAGGENNDKTGKVFAHDSQAEDQDKLGFQQEESDSSHSPPLSQVVDPSFIVIGSSSGGSPTGSLANKRIKTFHGSHQESSPQSPLLPIMDDNFDLDRCRLHLSLGPHLARLLDLMPLRYQNEAVEVVRTLNRETAASAQIHTRWLEQLDLDSLVEVKWAEDCTTGKEVGKITAVKTDPKNETATKHEHPPLHFSIYEELIATMAPVFAMEILQESLSF